MSVTFPPGAHVQVLEPARANRPGIAIATWEKTNSWSVDTGDPVECRVSFATTTTGEDWARAALGDGYRVEVRVVIWESARVVQVPTSALFRHGEKSAVYVMDAGRARRTVVELGRQTGQSAEVAGGPAEGARVILHPGDTLADDARVRERVPVNGAARGDVWRVDAGSIHATTIP